MKNGVLATLETPAGIYQKFITWQELAPEIKTEKDFAERENTDAIVWDAVMKDCDFDYQIWDDGKK